MPDFPISFFLIPYAVFIVIFLIFSFFNIYHLLRYGIYNFALYLLSVIYIGGTIFIIGASYILLSDYSWAASFSLDTIIGEPNQQFLELDVL